MPKSVELLDEVSPDVFGAPQHEKLRALADDLDSLVVIDPHTHQPAINEKAFVAFAGKHLPPAAAKGVVVRLKHEFPDHVTSQSGGRPIAWADLQRYTVDIVPPSQSDLRNEGLPHHASKDQVKAWMQQRHGKVLQQAEQLTKQQLDKIVQQLSAPSLSTTTSQENVTFAVTPADLWSCLVRHWGWWVTLAIVGTVGAIVIAASGPIGLPFTIWLIGAFGVGPATIILNCVLNPWG